MFVPALFHALLDFNKSVEEHRTFYSQPDQVTSRYKVYNLSNAIKGTVSPSIQFHGQVNKNLKFQLSGEIDFHRYRSAAHPPRFVLVEALSSIMITIMTLEDSNF